MIGVTDPGNCEFYWGAQVAVTGDGRDQPIQNISTTPPDPTPPDPVSDSSCGFSITDPSTWAGAGICELVKAIRGLVDIMQTMLGVLQELASAIAGPIVNAISGLITSLANLLQAMLIPDPSSWDIASVKDQWDSRPPGSLVDGMYASVTGVATAMSAGGSSCDLGSWTIEGHGVPLTCPKSSVPGYSALYALVSAALFGFTGLGLWHLFRGAVGNGGGSA